jgi:hypothetical protein
MASSTITAEHRQELVKWRYQFTQYAASGTVFSEIPNCGYNSSPDPKGESAFLPQSAPQSAPQSTPLSAHVSTPLSTPLNAPQSASLSAPLNAPQSIPLRASLNAPQNTPQNTPQSASLRAPLSTPVAPARVTAAPSAPRPTAALPDATCYITYSDGRTVNLESMCQWPMPNAVPGLDSRTGRKMDVRRRHDSLGVAGYGNIALGRSRGPGRRRT